MYLIYLRIVAASAVSKSIPLAKNAFELAVSDAEREGDALLAIVLNVLFFDFLI